MLQTLYLEQILATVDELVVQQEVEYVEAVANIFGIDFEGNNRRVAHGTARCSTPTMTMT